jgi:hypothetical protein
MMWAQIINALLGIWLMASPAILGYSGTGRINDLIVGPVAATSAIIAFWEVTRAVGKANVALGIWLIIASWVLGYESAIPVINEFVVGVAMVVFAMTRGKARAKFGGGWRSLMKTGTPS